MKKITIGTRGSKLALWQANHIKSILEKENPNIEFELNIIKTTGDKILDVALSKIGDKGLFTKELENALIREEIDLAVHSMKDVPTNILEGTFISTIIKREDTHDAFISNNYKTFNDLAPNSVVGTSSLRRKAQLMRARPDLNFKDIRGNVDTRLSKLDNAEYDAIILAYAGIHRLGLDTRVKEKISFEICLPAVGQGAIGIQIRQDDNYTLDALNKINDLKTFFCVSLERSFLHELEGGCQIPIGCQAYFYENRLTLEGVVLSQDGQKYINEKTSTDISLEIIKSYNENTRFNKSLELGSNMAQKFIKSGALNIVRELRS